jgi:hypothetical protein
LFKFGSILFKIRINVYPEVFEDKQGSLIFANFVTKGTSGNIYVQYLFMGKNVYRDMLTRLRGCSDDPNGKIA